jgi:hypothetical protein
LVARISQIGRSHGMLREYFVTPSIEETDESSVT